MIVPTPGVGVLLGCRNRLDLLEDLDVGLGWRVAAACQFGLLTIVEQMTAKDDDQGCASAWFCIQIAGS